MGFDTNELIMIYMQYFELSTPNITSYYELHLCDVYYKHRKSNDKLCMNNQ